MSRRSKKLPHGPDPPGLFGPIPVPAQRHSETSVAASVAIAPKVRTLLAKVRAAFIAAGADGLTDLECQERLSMKGDTQRPRRIKLQEDGIIMDSGRTRLTRFGKPAVVWVAVESVACESIPSSSTPAC